MLRKAPFRSLGRSFACSSSSLILKEEQHRLTEGLRLKNLTRLEARLESIQEGNMAQDLSRTRKSFRRNIKEDETREITR